MESDTTSHPRQSILTSFLGRGRPRTSVSSSPISEAVPAGNTTSGNGRGRRAQTSGAGLPIASNSTTASNVGLSHSIASVGLISPSTSLPSNSHMPHPGNINANAFTQMLRRRRSGTGPLTTNSGNNTVNNNSNAPTASVASPSNPTQATPLVNPGPAHRIRLVPHLENSRSLHFDPITRECREGAPPIRIGRFTDRTGTLSVNANTLTGKIAFKSKVVSRGHAELWCESNAKFYIKDTSSSSGTFLNHMRLSHAGVESRPFLLKDGDILQLGVDYQGGTEEIYRCVKIRVEIGREWQAAPNAFNTSALAQLRSLSNLPTVPTATSSGLSKTKNGSSKQKSSMSDCCICLFPVTVCQALFIAPCSHSFHYKCIRTTLIDHHPGFSCPLCRSFHNLEADVEVDLPEEEWEDIPEESLDQPDVIHADGVGDTIIMDTDTHPPNAQAAGVPWSSVTGEDEELPLRTAAEDNDQRVLIPSPIPAVPPGRRPVRRATMVQGTDAPPGPGSRTIGGIVDDIDRGFDTDGGVTGLPYSYGAETDMDLDEPSRLHGRDMNSGRGGRSTIYNLVDSRGGTPGPHGSSGNTTGASGHISSAPNLINHQVLSSGNQSSPPVSFAAAGPSSVVGRLSLDRPAGTHLFGDSGAAEKPDEIMNGDDHTVEGMGATLVLGSKRKR